MQHDVSRGFRNPASTTDGRIEIGGINRVRGHDSCHCDAGYDPPETPSTLPCHRHQITRNHLVRASSSTNSLAIINPLIDVTEFNIHPILKSSKTSVIIHGVHIS